MTLILPGGVLVGVAPFYAGSGDAQQINEIKQASKAWT